jgi:hypothetical protein
MRQNCNRANDKLRKSGNAKSTQFGGYLGNLRHVADCDLVDAEAHDFGKKAKPIGVRSLDATVGILYLALRSREKDLKRIFDSFDDKNAGELDSAQFLPLLQFFCPGEITILQARQVLKVLDENGDGLIQWEEITGFCKVRIRLHPIARPTSIRHSLTKISLTCPLPPYFCSL